MGRGRVARSRGSAPTAGGEDGGGCDLKEGRGYRRRRGRRVHSFRERESTRVVVNKITKLALFLSYVIFFEV